MFTPLRTQLAQLNKKIENLRMRALYSKTRQRLSARHSRAPLRITLIERPNFGLPLKFGGLVRSRKIFFNFEFVPFTITFAAIFADKPFLQYSPSRFLWHFQRAEKLAIKTVIWP